MNDPGTTRQGHGRKRTRPAARTVRVAAVSAVLVIGSVGLAYLNPFQAAGAAESAPACVPVTDSDPPPTTPPAPLPTTITTMQQAYECIFAHYYRAPLIDDRTVLIGAFQSFTAELQRRGIDRPQATLPKLTGNRTGDWNAFAETYQDVLDALPDDVDLRTALAKKAMAGMTGSLANHNGFGSGALPPDTLGLQYTFEGRPTVDVPPKDVRDATGPLYLTRVTPEWPAAVAGLKPGDIIEAVNGVPVFINGKLTVGALDLLHPRPSEQGTTKITVNRPATGATWTVELRPKDPADPADRVATVKLLDGGIADVVFPTFQDPDAVDQVLKQIADLRASTPLHGVIVDVRANGGGRGETVAKLLGAFAHDKVWGWSCDVKDKCTSSKTDDSVALLNLPLVELTDGRCASACDAFSSGVKDLRLGSLVGARTAGVVAGLPSRYRLDDNSSLELTANYSLAPNKEIINEIGVAVDYQAPMTAKDLSAGRDPALEKAVSLLTA